MNDLSCSCSPHQQPRCAHFRMGNCAEKPMPEGVARFPAKTGNGGREALSAAISFCLEPVKDELTDMLLARLWILGFKVAPLEPADDWLTIPE